LPMVGTARFELATPCAQDKFQNVCKSTCFQAFLFQANGARLLRLLELNRESEAWGGYDSIYSG
ncbi:MAG: hypothetical protein ABI995_13695, partial [Acidobacteriota bacterium]